MKYNLSKIMKKAHEIKAENKMNVWAECLKMAWNFAKTVTAIDVFDEEFLPTRKQVGVLYRAFKEGKLPVSNDRISEIYDQLREFEIDKMNYGFSYAKAHAGGLLFVSRAINAVFHKDYEAASIILG